MTMTGQSLHYWIDELGGGTCRDLVGDDVPGAENDHDVAVVSIGKEGATNTPRWLAWCSFWLVGWLVAFQ